jgi:nucleoid-associated protein YgaU
VVQPGDNLNKIAIKKFGKVDMVSRIYELNKQLIGDDPAKLKVGMVLNMPTAATAATAH